MPNVTRVGSLEIDHDMKFHQRSWRLQRVAWVIMALLLLAALLGLFGSGPLSRATLVDESGTISLNYERFARREAPTALRVHLAANAVDDDEIRLWISRDYIDEVEIERITPQPSATEVGVDRLIYTFQAVESGQPVTIILHLKAAHTGSLPGQLGLSERKSFLSFKHFVYP